jgi:hypothetical protein
MAPALVEGGSDIQALAPNFGVLLGVQEVASAAVQAVTFTEEGMTRSCFVGHLLVVAFQFQGSMSKLALFPVGTAPFL